MAATLQRVCQADSLSPQVPDIKISCMSSGVSPLVYPLIIFLFPFSICSWFLSCLFSYPCLPRLVPEGLWFFELSFAAAFQETLRVTADISLCRLKQSHPTLSRAGAESSSPAELFFHVCLSVSTKLPALQHSCFHVQFSKLEYIINCGSTGTFT